MDALYHIDWENLLETYGYWAILLGTFLEGETIVILAGMLVAGGHLSFQGVVCCSLAGSLMSDQLMFFLGRYKGNAVLARFPRLNRNKERVAKLLLKHDMLLMIGFRFVYGIRNVTPLMLGTSGVPVRRFLIFNIFGAVCWALTFTAGGFYFGHAILRALEISGKYAFPILIPLIALTAAGFFVFRLRKKRKTAEISSHSEAPGFEGKPESCYIIQQTLIQESGDGENSSERSGDAGRGSGR